jgi:SAM-dependent methyltransferase
MAWHARAARLARRSTAVEKMDTECRDYEDYSTCLRDLAQVNYVTRTHAPVLRWLRRGLGDSRSFSLLDVACGYGDLLRTVSRWAKRRGIAAQLTGVDRNPWATRAAADAAQDATQNNGGIRYVTSDVFEYEPDPTPDFIVSSQFAHHLDDATFPLFLAWLEARAARGWLVLDLRRHWIPYYGFPLLTWLFGWHRFIPIDGRISIARSLTADEWHAALDHAGLAQVTKVRRYGPFRVEISRLR